MLLSLVFSLMCVEVAWSSELPAAPKEELPIDSATVDTSSTPASADSPDIAEQRKQLREEIDRRLAVIEGLLLGRGHTRGMVERGLGWSPTQEERGFSLYSTDGAFRLHLNGGVQTQYNAFPGGHSGQDPGSEPDGFEFRRVRPIFDFRISRFIRGQIMPDLAPRRRTELYNAFLDFEGFQWGTLRVGQFKPALSLEKLQGEFDLIFAERSLVQNFVPFRDYGIQITGFPFQRQLRYDIGAFNGSPQAIGPANFAAPSTDSNKHLVARLMLTPFLLQGPRALRQLQLGVGVMGGSFTSTSGQQPMLTMGQDRTIFQYQSSVAGNGFHTRVIPQMMWFWGRLGVTSLFVHTWEPKRDAVTGKTAELQHQAWVVQTQFLLTDDEAAYDRATPKHPFDLSKPGAWGAWELALRYSEQRIDPATFRLSFADATQYVQTTKAFSVALNWYLSREVRLQWIWEHSDFTGANPAYQASGKDDMLITRLTLLY